jgi:hypothetical protein
MDDAGGQTRRRICSVPWGIVVKEALPFCQSLALSSVGMTPENFIATENWGMKYSGY